MSKTELWVSISGVWIAYIIGWLVCIYIVPPLTIFMMLFTAFLGPVLLTGVIWEDYQQEKDQESQKESLSETKINNASLTATQKD